jgi:hypothetical protein
MAFTCTLNDGFLLGCSTIGGVQKVWLGEWEDVVGYQQSANGTITGLTSGFTVYEFQADIEQDGLMQNGTYDRIAGTTFYQTDLMIKMIGLTADVRQRLVELGRAPLSAVVLSNAGDYYICGIETAGRATAGTASVGTALGDQNGVDLTISWKSANGIFLMAPALLGTKITIL